jgi:hypothetical protein
MGIVFGDGGAGYAGIYGVATNHASDYGDLAFVTRSTTVTVKKLRITSSAMSYRYHRSLG